MADIEANVKKILQELKGGNAYGEAVTLVAATKTRTAEEINRAIRAGITCVGENKVQEFRDKYDLLEKAERHFIGNLQANKIKYLLGKCDLIHSVGDVRLAEEISRLALSRGVVQNILIEINLGEAQKGGIPLDEADASYRHIKTLEGVKVKGCMAMLPAEGEQAYLASLCNKMRQFFEAHRERDDGFAYLSMGMSGDYRLCLDHGSNMVRLGTCIFGPRPLRPAE